MRLACVGLWPMNPARYASVYRRARPVAARSQKERAMNPDLRRRTDELCTRLTQLRDSL
jgi:hypothetical protein